MSDKIPLHQAQSGRAPGRCPHCRTPYRFTRQHAAGTHLCTACGKSFSLDAGMTATIPVLAQAPVEKTTEADTDELEQVTLPPRQSGAVVPSSPRDGKRGPGQDPQTLAEVLRLAGGHQKYGNAEAIARGGMGVILKVTDRAMHREVAMKVMRNDSNEFQNARFVEEAQVTGQLEHPNIVPIHEIGVDARGRLYFTMKLVKGQSIASLLKDMRENVNPGDRTHTLAHLLSVFRALCNAIAFAHSRGVVHRDIKPANIMLGDFGEVMVMDWGLARIGPARTSESDGDGDSEAQAVKAPARSLDADGSVNISSFRNDANAERTLEGVISGTPAYMSPEQARGDVTKIDERSDVYSLGAMLYEMLSLEQPIRGEDVEDILKKVRVGLIEPPEKVAPDRVVPSELSAITMKALANDPERRYQSVELLMHDIDLYLEGRAVSAKDDSLWEALVKWIKRNRAVSLVTMAAAASMIMVLYFSFISIIDQKNRAKRALDSTKMEEQQRHNEELQSAPVWKDRARRDIDAQSLEWLKDAHADIKQALLNNKELWECYLIRAKIYIYEQKYSDAQKDLSDFLDHQSPPATEAEAEEAREAPALLELCKIAQKGSSEFVHRFADVFERSGDSHLAQAMTHSSEGLLQLYRSRLREAWPDSDFNLTMEADGTCSLIITQRVLGDLAPLRGMPLTSLDLTDCKIDDLQPLKDMPLTSLRLGGTHVRDITPLKGMALRVLVLADATISNIALLGDMPLTELDLSGVQMHDLSPLAKLKLTRLDLSGCSVADLHFLHGMPVTELHLNRLPLTDLRVLKGLPLTKLQLEHTLVNDLEPLSGMALTSLDLRDTRVYDLSYLQGMPLSHLDVASTRLADLSSLLGIPLITLDISHTKISHLAALAGLPLTQLELNGTQIHDLSPLKGLRLTRLELDGVPVSDLTPLSGMLLNRLIISGTSINDLTPLKNMPLEVIVLPHKPPLQGLEVLYAMPTLKEIDEDLLSHTDRAQFWRTYGVPPHQIHR